MASVASLLCSNHIDRKRTHDQMSNESRPSPYNHHPRYDPTAQNAPASSNSFFGVNFPSLRRSFDLRRPIMSESRNHVIDLTDDTASTSESNATAPVIEHQGSTAAPNQAPQGNRTVINVDEHEDHPMDLREESPEIQFLTSRPRSRSLSATRRLRRRHPTARSPARRSQVPVRVSAAERIPHLYQARGLWSDNPRDIHFSRRYRDNGSGGADDEPAMFHDYPGGLFQVPDELNFLHAAFDFERPSRPQMPPRPPTYDAPPPPQTGFTRSPREDDILVCPHCEDELGIGDDEEKRQVWVIKACGHVYCGECTLHRSLKQSAQLSSKGFEPWSKCVVEGCGKPVSNRRSMIQVYL